MKCGCKHLEWIYTKLTPLSFSPIQMLIILNPLNLSFPLSTLLAVLSSTNGKVKMKKKTLRYYDILLIKLIRDHVLDHCRNTILIITKYWHILIYLKLVHLCEVYLIGTIIKNEFTIFFSKFYSTTLFNYLVQKLIEDIVRPTRTILYEDLFFFLFRT